MGRPSKGDRRQLTLRLPSDLHRDLKRYADYLNLTVNDAVELAIGNMLSQAKTLGADSPLARPWTEEAFLRSTVPDQADEILLRAKEDEAEILRARIEAQKEGTSEMEAEKKILLDRWMKSRMPRDE